MNRASSSETLKDILQPKIQFDRAALIALGRSLPADMRDEMAIPSYLHANPLIRWIVARRMVIVKNLVQLQNGDNVLDYGCGSGILFLQFPKSKGHYFGVDVETDAAATMLRIHQRDDVVLFNAADWHKRVPDGTLDSIVALEVLEHVDDVPVLATRFREKLKPEGRLIVSCPTENTFYKIGRKIAGFSGHYHKRDAAEIFGFIESAGFLSEVRRDLPVPGPLSAFVIQRFRME